MKRYEACSGCGICTMVCPAWWETRDVWFTPHGRARAVQGGATAEQMADSIASCRLCGACVPVCPEEIDIIAMERQLRVQLHENGTNRFTPDPHVVPPNRIEFSRSRSTGRLLLAGPQLEAMPALLTRVVDCLGGASRVGVALDDGRRLAFAYEAGQPLDEQKLQQFLSTLKAARELVVAESVLHRLLREHLPGIPVRGLAEALLDGKGRFQVLGPRDYLVVDARAYHANHSKLVRFFSRLRLETGCQMNLDLRQADATRAHGEIPETPVLFITQLLGLALGLSSKELGIEALAVSAASLLGERGIGDHPGLGEHVFVHAVPVGDGSGREDPGGVQVGQRDDRFDGVEQIVRIDVRPDLNQSFLFE